VNILFIDLAASLGGHTRTATTIAQALRGRGHEVSFVISDLSDSRVIDRAGLNVYRVKTAWTERYPALEPLVRKLHRQEGLHALHAFDWKGVPEAIKVAKALNIPFYHTICGGPGPQRAPISKTIISLSHEVKRRLLEVTSLKDEDVAVIPARLDLEALLAVAEAGEEDYAPFRKKYGLPDAAKVVMRVVRVAPEYETSLLQGADAVAKLYREGREVRFLHLGFVTPTPGGRASFERVRAHFERINRDLGETVVVSAQDEAPEAIKYLNLAEVVLGTGRAAFEGMLFSKPVIIAGVNGYAGVVDAKGVDDVAFYNFSGRNVGEAKPQAQSVEELAEAIRRLLSDRAYYESVAAFGRAYVQTNLDVRVAAERYEALYRSFSRDRFPTDEQIRERLRLNPRVVAKTLLPDKLHRGVTRLLSLARR